MKKRNQGFTLVEIMIVVVIIALLAALAIPAFQKARADSWGSKMTNDAKQLTHAAQIALMQNPTMDATAINFDYQAENGIIGSTVISAIVRQITKGYNAVGTLDATVAGAETALTITHPRLGARTFTVEGFSNQNMNY